MVGPVSRSKAPRAAAPTKPAAQPRATTREPAPSAAAAPRKAPKVVQQGTRQAVAGEEMRKRLARDPEAARRPALQLRMVDFNVAGGSDSRKKNFEGQTSEHLAREIIRADAQVATLQEVKINSVDGNYPTEILEDLAEERLGSGWRVDEEHARYFDSHGQRLTDPADFNAAARIEYDVANGRRHKELVITRERVDVPVEGGEGRRDVSVFSSSIDGEPGHAVVFGSSGNAGRKYGNAVVLGPDVELPRTAEGRVDPTAVHLGLLGRDPDDGEPRSALAVTAQLNGQRFTAMSAHLTNRDGNDASREAAIFEQYLALDSFRRDWSRGLPSVIGADLNSVPGTDGLPQLGSGVSWGGTDAVVVNGGAGSRVENARARGEGGSDHDLAVMDVVLKPV